MSLSLDSRPLHGRRQGREIAPRAVDVHARWKPERKRDEDRAVDQNQLILSSKCVLEQPMERIPNEYWSISNVCFL